MKNRKFIQAMNTIEPDDDAQRRMLGSVLGVANESRLKERNGSVRRNVFSGLTLRWLAPAAVCCAVVVMALFAAPNLLNAPGKIIVGAAPDPFGNAPPLEEDGLFEPVYISQMLRDALKKAGKNDRIKTVVMVPGFWDYLYQYEEDGMTYSELLSFWAGGSYKYEHSREEAERLAQELYGKMEQMQKNAADKYLQSVLKDWGIDNAEVDLDYYPKFVAVLTPATILALEQEKCFMWLWSADGYCEPPGFTDDLVTTG